MTFVEQDADGYTERSIVEMLNDPPEPEWTEVRITDTDLALSQRYGAGAIWPPAAPTSTKGAAPFWIERWGSMWAVLAKSGHTQKAQLERFRRMAEIASGLRGNSRSDPQAMAEFRTLEAATHAPVVVGSPEYPLWAVTTEIGLLLVLAPMDAIQSLVDTRQVALLRRIPDGVATMVRIDSTVQIVDGQVPYWSWAACQLGYLFRLDETETDVAPPSKTDFPDKTPVVKPELPPMVAIPGRRR